MPPLEELTVLPGRGAAILCRVTGEGIEPLHTLPFRFKNRHDLGGNRWLIAFIEEKSTPWSDLMKQSGAEAYLYRAKIEQDGTLTRMPDIQLPAYILNQTLAIKDDILYLGGYEVKREGRKTYSKVNEGEMAGYFDLRLDKPVWHPLPLPVEMQPGKSIDDVLVYDDKLVLVDNIMYPKYLFEYDVSVPSQPVSTKTIELPNNGTYEHIHRGSINSRWMALLSSGVGRSGSSSYVSVFSLPGYEQILTVHLRNQARDFFERDRFTTLEQELEQARKTVGLHDFAVAGDTLLIACGHHGLGVFPLQELLERYQARSEEETRPSWVSSGRHYDLAGIYDNGRHLRKVEGLEEVHRLVQQPGGGIVAVSFGETNLKLEYKVLEV